MELSRIKLLFGGLILQLLFTIAVPLPYNKYGRQCSDIGCLSSQVCVMAYDSCSLGQREGNECGRYPTCKKKTDAGLAAGPSDNAQDLFSNQPTPPKSAPPADDDDVLSSLGLNPNSGGGGHSRPSAPTGGYVNPYPAVPAPAPTPAPPRYPPAPAGGSNYYGGGGGAGSGGSSRPGQFDGSGGNIVVPTQKPAQGGGGFFGGIFSGIQNAVSNAVKQQVGTYINQRLGIGPAAGQAGGAGGLGGLLDARNFIDNKKFGGLFSENKPSSSGSRSGSESSESNYRSAGGSPNVGPYPVTVDQRTQVYSSQQAQPAYRGTTASEMGRNRQQGTPPPYGWKLD